MGKTNINRMFSEIDTLVAGGRYQEALKKLPALEKHTNKHPFIALDYAGFHIDIGSALRDSRLVEKGLRIAKSTEGLIEYGTKEYGSCCYNIANAIAIQVEWEQRESGCFHVAGNEKLEEAKAYYRKALGVLSIPQVWVNYGSLLNRSLCRTLEAFECFMEALKHNPEFAMALANKGDAQSYFARVTGGDAGEVLLRESYQSVKKALSVGLEAGPKRYFTELLEDIRKKFRKPEVLDKDPIRCRGEIPKTDKPFYDFYREFCHKERLFLNPLGDDHRCEAALCDPLTIKSMVTGISDDKYYRFASYVNQLKQEFVAARLLAAQSYYQDSELKLVDEGVTILDTLDYAVHSIFIELAKAAFRLSYSILDKVAFVANEYLNLGFKPERLYFWMLSPFQKENPLRDQSIENPFFVALMDLATDFYKGFFQEIKDSRHSFEHRIKTVHQDFGTPRLTLDEITGRKTPPKEKQELLKASEIRSQMLEMLRISKAAIFYLVLLIDWSERQKKKDVDPRKAVPFFVRTVPDDLKGEL